MGWRPALLLLDQETVGRQLHDVGRVGCRAGGTRFDLHGNDTLACGNQVVGTARQLVFSGKEGSLAPIPGARVHVGDSTHRQAGGPPSRACTKVDPQAEATKDRRREQ